MKKKIFNPKKQSVVDRLDGKEKTFEQKFEKLCDDVEQLQEMVAWLLSEVRGMKRTYNNKVRYPKIGDRYEV